MTMRLSTLACLAAPLALYLSTATPASAQAPKQLYNKSVFVGMSVSIPARGTDGSSADRPRSVQRVIYISSAGRVFAKVTRAVGKNQQQKERGPEDTGGGGGLRFVGNRLTGVLQFQSGASLMNIDFDPSFQSCTVNVIVGRDSGKPIVFKGLNGITYTSTGPPVVGGQSCSIRDGNALAN
ncbi:MAG: hypothetical protein A4S14_07850 [Proteobacteria bacterium SG_bin9]|nr:MAG: hypothetical protein A4S14_07850 [Proteobacteria bacterium SG_bin9]